MYRNFQQRNLEGLENVTQKKARTARANSPSFAWTGIEVPTVAYHWNIRQREGKRFSKLQGWTKFRRKFQEGNCTARFHIRTVCLSTPSFLGTLKFPAVVGNNGLLVKTYLESLWQEVIPASSSVSSLYTTIPPNIPNSR